MEGCIAPGFVFHPRPAPRVAIDPVAVVIRLPVHGHAARIPHRTVVGVGLPAAIGVQVRRASHILAHVLIRRRIDNLPVALLRPQVQVVGAANLQPLRRHRIHAGQFQGLHRIHRLVKVARCGHVGSASVVGKDGRRVGKDVDAHVARLLKADVAVRRAQVELLVLPQPKRAQMHRTLRHAEADALVGSVDKTDVGIGADAQIGLANLDLGASVGVGVDAVARAQREVGISLAPLVGAHRLHGNLPGDRGDTRRLIRRIGVLLLRGGSHAAQRHKRHQECWNSPED